MERELTDKRRVFLSTLPTERGERRLALAVVLVSVAIFLAAVPFARVPLAPIWTFIPIYESALVINDLITAVLLFGQFSFLRSRALCVLASGYLFTAFMAVAHALTFPGLFSPTGLLGAGPQSTAWLYMFWHGGFPLLVIAYALLKEESGEPSRGRVHAGGAVLSSGAAVLVVVCGLTLLATAGQDALPSIMRGTHYTPAMIVVVSSVWVLSLLALAVLWRRRPHTVLDLWLMVVMCAWLLDIALAAVLNAGRFDLGFYAGRVYGLLAASFVLMVLLIENGRLYARLVEAHEGERRARQRVQEKTTELISVNAELATEVTARRRAEEELRRQNEGLEAQVQERTQQLLQAEKLTTMGNLLAGVAHELNNPLAIIVGHVTLLLETAPDDRVRTRGQKIGTAAERCVRIVRNFLAMARQHPPERGEVRLNQVVQEAVELLAYELRTDSVEVVLSLMEDLPVLWADAHQLHQVLVNLVANAYQAMRHQPTPRRIEITTGLDPQRARIQLAVTDTGPGIPREIQQKIFEPFFTTKPSGEGTGLGLSLCRGIIEEHGGALRVESEPGRGTTFLIELPLVTARVPSRQALERESLPALEAKHILVVDDEPEIAALLAEALQLDGHHVDTATNGAMALTMLDQQTYDLVLSDTKMPVLDGEGFYRELARRFPTLRERIIFVTGDVINPEKREFLEATGAPFVLKPFAPQEVRRLVHQVLAGVRHPKIP